MTVKNYNEEKEEYEESGRGKHKVTYVHPDKNNIGNDRFTTKKEAEQFAKQLKKKGYHDVTIGEETAAAATIKAKPSDATKAGMMASAMGVMAGMNKNDLSSWLEQALALIGHEADTIPPDAAAKNAASVAMKGSPLDIALPNLGSAMKEDIAELFGSEELTEEFKEKTSVLFEAAVNARVLAEVAALEEQYEEKLNEEIDFITESLAEKVDQYLTYVAETWAQENQVAIESSLRAEITEGFIDGLRNLFAEHYVTFPENKVDVVESLVTENEKLREKLNEEIKFNIELTSLVEDYTKEDIFNEASEGLALTQVQKFKTLVEGVEFDDVESYKKKLAIVKENYFKQPASSKPTSFITEELEADESTEVRYLEPQIAHYASAISRTAKK